MRERGRERKGERKGKRGRDRKKEKVIDRDSSREREGGRDRGRERKRECACVRVTLRTSPMVSPDVSVKGDEGVALSQRRSQQTETETNHMTRPVRNSLDCTLCIASRIVSSSNLRMRCLASLWWCITQTQKATRHNRQRSPARAWLNLATVLVGVSQTFQTGNFSSEPV